MINFSIVLPAHVRSCVYYSAVSTSDYILALFVACRLEPCADVSISAAARRVILTGGGGAPIDFFQPRRRFAPAVAKNFGGGGATGAAQGSSVD